MVVHQEGDVVFFLMCPYTLEAAPQDEARLTPKPQSGGKLGWDFLCPFAPGQGETQQVPRIWCGFSRRAFCREPLRTGGK